jgi:excisionase family DNA binding protein
MFSVKQTAAQLEVSEQRVRNMIYDGILPAERDGMRWLIFEEAVTERKRNKPQAGRPRRDDRPKLSSVPHQQKAPEDIQCARKLYQQCKEQLRGRYDFEFLSAAKSAEERGFYVAVADYFLQCKQLELIEKGIF